MLSSTDNDAYQMDLKKFLLYRKIQVCDHVAELLMQTV